MLLRFGPDAPLKAYVPAPLGDSTLSFFGDRHLQGFRDDIHPLAKDILDAKARCNPVQAGREGVATETQTRADGAMPW